MSWVAAAIAGSAVVGYLGNQQSAGQAASAQRDAANQASATDRYIFDQQQQTQKPWLQAGQQALGQIQSNLGDLTKSFSMADFKEDPGYQFQLQEGQKALERAAGARGAMGSGATLKALTNYSQGVASNEFGNAYNRFNSDRDQRFNKLASLAGIGQSSANTLTSAAGNYGSNVSQNQMAAGNATAAQAIAGGNNLSSMIGNGTNSMMNYNLMQHIFPTGGGGGGGGNPTSGWSPPQLSMPEIGSGAVGGGYGG